MARSEISKVKRSNPAPACKGARVEKRESRARELCAEKVNRKSEGSEVKNPMDIELLGSFYKIADIEALH